MEKIVLASSEYPPYFGEELADHGGLSEIIVQAYRRVGYEVEIRFYPWMRALEATRNGECDGMFALWHTQAREEWFVFSEPLPGNQIGFYKRKSDPIHFTTLEDLKPYRIGTVSGYANPPAFQQATYLEKEEANRDIQNLRKLANNRIDLALMDKGVGAYLLKNKLPEYQDLLVWMDPALEIMPEYLVLSKRVPDYQKKLVRFNQGLAQLVREGVVERIRAEHGF